MALRDLPPIATLRAFTAFAETRNVVAAGEMLNISHPAISQQLRRLEDHLGLTLLDRTGRALALTTDGEALAQACLQGFGEIANTINALTGASDARPLHITTTPTFASAWLMPRLAGFQQAHPGQQLLINPTPHIVTLDPGGIDLAIRYGMPPFPGLEATPLLISPMMVVAAPALVAGRPTQTAEDLAQFPWLEELGTSESTNWLRNNGAVAGPQAGFMQVPGNLLLDGARAAQGVAVTVQAFVQADLDAGRLICLRCDDVSQSGYHLVTRPGPQRPALRLFTRWLKKTAQG